MTQMYDPLKDEVLTGHTAAVRPKRKSPVQIDWKRAASLIVAGNAPDAVAATLGIAEDRIWRHLRDSLRFRHYLRQAMERQALLARIAFTSAAPAAVVAYLRQAQGLDPESMRWLAQHTGVIDAAAAQTAGETDLVARLGETGRRPRPTTPGATRQAAAAPGEASDTGEVPRSAASLSELPRSAASLSETPRSAASIGEPPPAASGGGDGRLSMPGRSPPPGSSWAMVRAAADSPNSHRRPVPG